MGNAPMLTVVLS